MSKKWLWVLACCAACGVYSCANETVDWDYNEDCVELSHQCADNAVMICTNGQWQIETLCTGDAPVCDPASFTCAASSTTCPEDEKRCNGNTVEVCKSNAWVLAEMCGDAKVCNPDTKTCEPAATTQCDYRDITIESGRAICDTASNSLVRCMEDGSLDISVCEGQICREGGTACSDFSGCETETGAIVHGAKACRDNNVFVCRDGVFELDRACEDGTACSAETLDCIVPPPRSCNVENVGVIESGAKACSGAVLVTCSDGMAENTVCMTEIANAEGVCIDNACSFACMEGFAPDRAGTACVSHYTTIGSIKGDYDALVDSSTCAETDDADAAVVEVSGYVTAIGAGVLYIQGHGEDDSAIVIDMKSAALPENLSVGDHITAVSNAVINTGCQLRISYTGDDASALSVTKVDGSTEAVPVEVTFDQIAEGGAKNPYEARLVKVIDVRLDNSEGTPTLNKGDKAIALNPSLYENAAQSEKWDEIGNDVIGIVIPGAANGIAPRSDDDILTRTIVPTTPVEGGACTEGEPGRCTVAENVATNWACSCRGGACSWNGKSCGSILGIYSHADNVSSYICAGDKCSVECTVPEAKSTVKDSISNIEYDACIALSCELDSITYEHDEMLCKENAPAICNNGRIDAFGGDPSAFRACEAPTPYCAVIDWARCVECIEDAHCGDGKSCAGNICIRPCTTPGAERCVSAAGNQYEVCSEEKAWGDAQTKTIANAAEYTCTVTEDNKVEIKATACEAGSHVKEGECLSDQCNTNETKCAASGTGAQNNMIYICLDSEWSSTKSAGMTDDNAATYTCTDTTGDGAKKAEISVTTCASGYHVKGNACVEDECKAGDTKCAASGTGAASNMIYTCSVNEWAVSTTAGMTKDHAATYTCTDTTTGDGAKKAEIILASCADSFIVEKGVCIDDPAWCKANVCNDGMIQICDTDTGKLGEKTACESADPNGTVGCANETSCRDKGTFTCKTGYHLEGKACAADCTADVCDGGMIKKCEGGILQAAKSCTSDDNAALACKDGTACKPESDKVCKGGFVNVDGMCVTKKCDEGKVQCKASDSNVLQKCINNAWTDQKPTVMEGAATYSCAEGKVTAVSCDTENGYKTDGKGGCEKIAGWCSSDANCSGKTPVCNTTSHKCVECTSDTNCAGSSEYKTKCDTSKNICVLPDNACNPETDSTTPVCKNGKYLKCDNTTHTWIAVGFSDSNLKCDGDVLACIEGHMKGNYCVECTEQSHCEGKSGRNYCNTETSQCVVCKPNSTKCADTDGMGQVQKCNTDGSTWIAAVNCTDDAHGKIACSGDVCGTTLKCDAGYQVKDGRCEQIPEPAPAVREDFSKIKINEINDVTIFHWVAGTCTKAAPAAIDGGTLFLDNGGTAAHRAENGIGRLTFLAVKNNEKPEDAALSVSVNGKKLDTCTDISTISVHKGSGDAKGYAATVECTVAEAGPVDLRITGTQMLIDNVDWDDYICTGKEQRCVNGGYQKCEAGANAYSEMSAAVPAGLKCAADTGVADVKCAADTGFVCIENRSVGCLDGQLDTGTAETCDDSYSFCNSASGKCEVKEEYKCDGSKKMYGCLNNNPVLCNAGVWTADGEACKADETCVESTTDPNFLQATCVGSTPAEPGVVTFDFEDGTFSNTGEATYKSEKKEGLTLKISNAYKSSEKELSGVSAQITNGRITLDGVDSSGELSFNYYTNGRIVSIKRVRYNGELLAQSSSGTADAVLHFDYRGNRVSVDVSGSTIWIDNLTWTPSK